MVTGQRFLFVPKQASLQHLLPGKRAEKAVQMTVIHRKLRAMIRNQFILPTNRCRQGREIRPNEFYRAGKKESPKNQKSQSMIRTCAVEIEGRRD